MSKREKLIKRFLSEPTDFTFHEMCLLLSYYGFYLCNNGRTSGSSVSFYRKEDNVVIRFHKPHPGNILKQYVLRDVKKMLEQNGYM